MNQSDSLTVENASITTVFDAMLACLLWADNPRQCKAGSALRQPKSRRGAWYSRGDAASDGLQTSEEFESLHQSDKLHVVDLVGDDATRMSFG